MSYVWLFVDLKSNTLVDACWTKIEYMLKFLFCTLDLTQLGGWAHMLVR